MGAQRTSMKDVLEAINSLTTAVMTLVEQKPVTQAPVITEAPAQIADPLPASRPAVEAGYLKHMVATVTKRAKLDGEDYVLYARKNQYGETKLAYRKASQMGSLKDRGYIGNVKLIKAA